MPGINKSDERVCENIWVAAGDGRVSDVEQYLQTGGFGNGPLSPDVQDEFGYTPLHAAASYGHTELTRLLVTKYGALVNTKDMEGDTALHLAESEEVASLLVELGADPTIRNDLGYMPIETAYIEGWVEVVDYLKRKSQTALNTNIVGIDQNNQIEFTPQFERHSADTDDGDSVCSCEQLECFDELGMPVSIRTFTDDSDSDSTVHNNTNSHDAGQ